MRTKISGGKEVKELEFSILKASATCRGEATLQ